MEKFDLKKELQTVIEQQKDRTKIFDELDHQLLKDAKRHLPQWNVLGLDFTGRKVPLKSYYYHLADVLGSNVVQYIGHPTYQIIINQEALVN